MSNSDSIPSPADVNTPLDAYRLFCRLLPPDFIDQRQPSAEQAVYTAFVTIWLLLHQRLHGDAPLDDAVSALLFNFPKEDLPDCKRIHDDSLSANNSGYSKARKRLRLDTVVWLADRVVDSLQATRQPAWKGRAVQLLDGTSFSLAPTAELRAAYPPPTNQYGPSHWPIMQVVVAHDLDSGMVCRPEYGAMYGENNDCESSLTRRLLPRLPPCSLLLADGNFGIFIIAYEARMAGHDVLFRLSQPRFHALLAMAKPVRQGRWEIDWKPSSQERKKYAEQLPANAWLKGYLVDVPVRIKGQDESLYLFSTLEEGTNEELAGLYGRRWCVETDIEAGKVTLCLGRVSGKTAAMVEKEVVLATVAYNLVVHLRKLAAAKVEVPPRQLSFKGTASLFRAFTAKVASARWSEESLQREFDKLLRAISQRKLPKRPKRKAYPRELIPRRRRYPERSRHQAVPLPSRTPGTPVQAPPRGIDT